MYSATTKELSISLFMCLETLTLDKSKWYFVEMKIKKKIFIANVNIYRYSNLIKTDNILEQTAVLL